ncbi:MAG: hypothetical protein AABW57_02105 [Nanoarchaeota archaeon]
MNKGKKGALELSVNTIVVIVIGVTLLILGLVFVRNIFTKIDTLSADSFAKAEGELGKLSGVDKLLTLSPQRIDVEKGGAKQVNVIIANLEENPISVSAKATSSKSSLKCVFNDNIPFDSTSETYNIPSGEQIILGLIVDDLGSNVGIEGCPIELFPTTLKGQRTGTVTVNIKPKESTGSLFG